MLIINIKNEICNITTVYTDIKRKIRMYNEQLHVDKFDKFLHIKNKFLEIYKLAKLT